MGDDMSSRERDAPDFGVLFALAFGCYVDQLHAALGERGFVGIRSAFGPVLRALHAGDRT